MAPTATPGHGLGTSSTATPSATQTSQVVTKPTDPNGLVLEAWSQGYVVGSLIIMAAITIANMRKGVLLHKLILIELIIGTFHCTFIFNNPPVYGWYLSCTAILLNASWSLHNVVAWMKTKPFLSKNWSRFYIGTVILAQPYWVVEIYANFTYFNNINKVFLKTRPYEALFRDPWWIFTTVFLFYTITSNYHMTILTVIRVSPRFGVLLAAMSLSICFIIVDICAVTNAFEEILPDGLNPFWKMAMVFKCLTDSIILDDFKTALDKLMKYKMQKDHLDSVNRPSGTFKKEESRDDGSPQDPFGDHAVDGDRADERNRKKSIVKAEEATENITFDEMVKGESQARPGAMEPVRGPVSNYEDLPDLKMK